MIKGKFKTIIEVGEVRMTTRQYAALLYASGDISKAPTYGVAKTLEKKGWISWNGPYRKAFGAAQMSPISGKVWVLTSEGKRAVKVVEKFIESETK